MLRPLPLLVLLLLLALVQPSFSATIPDPSTTFRKSRRKSRTSLSPAFVRATEVDPSKGRFASGSKSKASSASLNSRRLLSALAADPADYYYPSEPADFIPNELAGHIVSKVEVDAEGEDGGMFQDGPDDAAGPEGEGEVPEPPEPPHGYEQQERQDADQQRHADHEQRAEQRENVDGAARLTNPVDVSKTIRAAAADAESSTDRVAPEAYSGQKEFRTVPEMDSGSSSIRAASDADSDEPPPAAAPSKKKATGNVVRSSSSGGEGGGSSGGGGGSFKGIDLGVVDGTNITHLSYMLFKIIKSYDVRSVVDIPCRNTLGWFPQLLHRIDFEVVGFKYYCVDSDKHSQDDIRSLFSDAGSPEFLHIRPEEAHLLPKTDLVFSWDGPQQWGVKRTWSFFTALREIRPTYLMITNNPKVANTNEQRGLLNLRKQPFHFAQALRVISHVHEDENPKQLLFYEMSGVRRGF